MFDRSEFESSKRQWLDAQAENKALDKAAHDFVQQTVYARYTYQWSWMGLPIIQMPGDMVAMQEILWRCRPDVIVETGIAWGGSTLMYASILELIGNGRIIAVDRVLPDHNRDAIIASPLSKRMTLIEGSSIDDGIVAQVKSLIKPGETVMVVLDSNHTHDHVLAELRAYGPLVSKGNYAVVFDTLVEHTDPIPGHERPWGKGNNPLTAADAYLAETPRFRRDGDWDAKIQASYARGGYLLAQD